MERRSFSLAVAMFLRFLPRCPVIAGYSLTGLVSTGLVLAGLGVTGCTTQGNRNGEDQVAAVSELGQDSGDKPYKYDGAESDGKAAYTVEDLGEEGEVVLSEDELEAIQARVRPGEPIQEETGEGDSAEELVEDYVHSLPSSTPDHEMGQFPLVMNDRVQKWIDYFTVKDRERFIRFMERGSKYRATIEEVLVKEGLPKEIYYLAFIESGFSNFAKSHASAVGIWQFIRGTATRYGLRVDRHVDERSDPLRATLAAAKYLKDLFRVYQDWNLAMASYNAGEGRVLRGIMKGIHRDYWRLVDEGLLPRETSDYVPKIIAARIVGENPGKYGLPTFSPAPRWEVKGVNVSARSSLEAVARANGLSKEMIIAFNPHLRSGMSPGGKSQYKIWVPSQGSDMDLLAIAADMQGPTLSSEGQSSASRFKVHRVRRGESVYSIARKYQVTMTQLRSANPRDTRNNRVQAGARLAIPTRDSHDGAPAEPSPPTNTLSAKAKGRTLYHVVRRGENLTQIARRYGVQVDEIKEQNKRSIRGSRILAGTRLKIVQVAFQGASSSQRNEFIKSSGSTRQKSRYRVRRGDNLAAIAQKFGTSVRAIKSKNRLDNSLIVPGQLLVINP